MSKQFNVPILQDAPPGFPVSTLPIQRALVSLSLSHPQKLERAIELCYENFWAHWNDPTKPENLQAILGTVLGSDEEAQKVIARTKTDEVKQALGGNTTKAFEDGAFGLPWFVGKRRIGALSDNQKVFVDHVRQLPTREERPRGTGASITWVSYVTIWVWRGRLARNGAHCCKKSFTIGRHDHAYSPGLCIPRRIPADHSDCLPLTMLAVTRCS